MDIIDFNKEHAKRYGPDGEFISVDADGIKWFLFECLYNDEGKEYGFELWAKDHDDCARRIELIGVSGNVQGQIFMKRPS